MNYCEISGNPIPDIRPKEYWVVCEDNYLHGTYRSRNEALNAISWKHSLKCPMRQFHVEEV